MWKLYTPIFEGAKNNVEIQDVLKIDSTAAHMIIYCDEKSRETRIVHNPLAFNKLAKIGKNCTINLAGYVGNVYEISNKPIFPNGSFSDNGMSVYKCLFMDYVINNKTKDEDPEDDVLQEYVKEKKIFYNNLDSDSFKFISDILNVEQFTYMGELLYRLTIKVRKSLRSKDMMEIFLYVGESCLKGHTPKVGEYIYGNCGLIGYMGDWDLITQKIKLDKQDEQYIKEMMELYGLTKDQAIKSLGILRAHGF